MDVDSRWANPDPSLRKRGRKSAASLAVIPVDVRMRRPKPPSRLTPEERRVWKETTETVKPGWFSGSEGLLETFCRSVVIERRLATWLDQITDPFDDRFSDLLRMHRSEAMLVANLATKLRLTVRSTKDRYTAKLVPQGPKPWDIGTSRDDDEPEPSPGA